MTPPRHEQFLISADPPVLQAVIDLLQADPDVEVVSVATTSPSRPERLVVAMDPAQAEALGTALGRLLVIEPDELLFPPTV